MSGSFASLARLPLGGVPFAAPASGAYHDPLENVGRRGAPRLSLSIPAKLMTVSETRRCVLLDVSRSGARIGIAKPIEEGDAGFLRFADYDLFATVARTEDGRNGLEFEVELSDDDVLAIRRYAETYEMSERTALMDEARAWVTGVDSD